jgi:hypothetical protein
VVRAFRIAAGTFEDCFSNLLDWHQKYNLTRIRTTITPVQSRTGWRAGYTLVQPIRTARQMAIKNPTKNLKKGVKSTTP